LAEGDKARAKEFFEKSAGTKVMEFTEYTLARRALDMLARQGR